MSNIVFFKKRKIKKKHFKKKTHLLGYFLKTSTKNKNFNGGVYKGLNFYKKYLNRLNLINSIKKIKTNKKTSIIVSISQKKFNPKCTIHEKKNINTFSVGSIIKYFKIKQSKYIRRSLKGLKIFLNFLKNALAKFYIRENKKHVVFYLSGVDYNLINLKKSIKTLIGYNSVSGLLFLTNIKISFSKRKEKKIKAIKKRLKKKLISNFIKNTI